jgi:hypothetical protein
MRVRSDLPKANEMVQWTISSDERPERKRRAGGRRFSFLTLSLSKSETA